MKLDHITETLRTGIVEIISMNTPPHNRESAKKYRRSSHPTREFLFVISGYSTYMFNDSVYQCFPGTLFLIDSGLPHGHRYIQEDNNLIHLWGYFHDRSMHLSIVEVQNGESRSYRGMSRFIMPEGIFRQIEKRWNLLEQCENLTDEQISNYIKSPLNAALDEMAFRIERLSRETMEHTKIEDLQEYIRSQKGRECSLERLAIISGYTRGYIAHKFRSETGMTVGKYVEQIRLEYVRSALKRGLRQKEMAYELGFSSPAAFWNWFNKYRDQFNIK